MSEASAPELNLPRFLVEQAVAAALAEDLGGVGDITTDAIIPAESQGEASIVAGRTGVIAGLDLAEAAFKSLDPEARFTRVVVDGGKVEAGGTIVTVAGKTRALLTGERIALNFLGRLSGIATLSAAYVAAIQSTRAKIVETRKTTPGLRALEKYAVRCGGGVNHRFGLYDAALVKDNHIEAVLLDNMNVETLKKAVALVNGRVVTEASGGVTLENVGEIAKTGVDLISVGALTHSARSLDSSLEWTGS